MSRGRQIGRLKLRPLAPENEKKYLLNWPAVSLHKDPLAFPPPTSPGVFGNKLPLEVEIGPGSGEYLAHLALHAPEKNFLGIEVSRRSAFAAVSQLAAAKLENARILRADFKLLLPLIQPSSWLAVYLHYPDPAHRPKDAKRTLFDQSFLDGIATGLVVGGTLSVVSDNPAYFEKMLALSEADKRFAKTHSERFLGFEPEVKSRFQRSWEKKGQLAKQFVLRKV